MSIFQESKPEMAYLKMGIYGGAGSGKTYTASQISIGLHKFIKAKKPVYALDSETGMDFVQNKFNKAKIKFMVAKSRTFKDLIDAIDEVEREGSILIIDSITHFWNEIMDAYQKKHNLSRITLRHWIPIKAMWRQFTERYVNSKLHIIMCGRVGDVWEDVEDEEGVLETKKTGTKMKAEVETAFEPSLLVEMQKHRQSARPGAGWVHRAWIVKDRFDVIDGKCFDDPGFEQFLPHIQLLNIGGEHKALDDTNKDSQELFDDNNIGEKYYKRRKAVTEKIQNGMYLLYPGQTTDHKTKRLELLEEIFDTNSWNEICELQVEVLEHGLDKLKERRTNVNV